MSNVALCIGGSLDGTLFPRPAAGFLSTIRVPKKTVPTLDAPKETPWPEKMSDAGSAEIYELQRLMLSLDREAFDIFEVYVLKDFKKTFTSEELNQIRVKLGSSNAKNSEEINND